MSKQLNMFISSDKQLEAIIKSLNLYITRQDRDYLVCELYRHIEHTRIISFKNGYEQGLFDEKMGRY
jgi:hypothetical protein